MSGLINDASTPSDMPSNEWTQMIEAVQARNRSGMSLSAAEIAGVPTVGTPMPTARSAELGKAVEDANRPLTAEENEELNQKALRSGFVHGPVNASIARTLGGASGMEDSPYASLEEAIAAGAPVDADEEAISEGARRFREPTPVTPVGDRMTAREFIGRSPRLVEPVQLPRLPDFKKVQMIDMVNGKVYVDGLEFAIEPAELKMLRKFCITKAKEQIESSLKAALGALSEDTDGGTEAV